MCEATRAIERHPETQRKILDISRLCKKIVEAVLQHVNDDEEDPRGLARRHV